MIEDLPLEGLSELELDRRLRSIEAQARRGVAESRLPAVIARIEELRGLLGMRPSVRQIEHARAVVKHRACRVLLEDRPLEGLTVAELLTRRRSLTTTARVNGREQAIELRLAEIDRLLGGQPHEYGRLRWLCERIERGCFDLGCADLEYVERGQTLKSVASWWRQAVKLCDKLGSCALSDAAKAHVVECWRRITRASEERIAARKRETKTIFSDRELAKWRETYRLADIPWPFED